MDVTTYNFGTYTSEKETAHLLHNFGLDCVFLNWKNSRLGYWLNLGVVGAADIGLFVFLIIPGYMALADGFSGPLLWLLAFVFSTIGLWQNRVNTV